MANRRDRQRTATLDEIKATALAHLTKQGPSGLTLRGIARDIGMSPAGLYRYYDGLDEIVTSLLVDAYRDLADAVAAAAERGPTVRDRLRAAMLGYREWALAQPNRFLLIFGTPIPGYAAPQGGPTVAENLRIGAVFFGLVAAGHARGELHVPAAGRPATEQEEAFVADLGLPLPADRVAAVLGAWAHFHGMVTLEVLHQLDFVYPDAHDFYTGEVERILRQW